MTDSTVSAATLPVAGTEAGLPNLLELATALDQIGVVVPDLAVIETSMKLIFGLEPKLRSRNHYAGAQWRDQVIDTQVDALFYELLGMELEFLSPRGGPDIWQEFVDEHGGGGLHHIRFAVSEHDRVVETMTSRGIEVRQSGDSMRGGGVRYAYFDTVPNLGFFVEILSTPTSGETDS